jgi:hypothetical protein
MTSSAPMPRWPRLLAALIAGFIAVALLVMACLPYGSLKTLLGAPMPDGRFNSLNEADVLAFRGLFLLGGLFWMWLGYLAVRGNLNARHWLDARRQEIRSLAAALRSDLRGRYILLGLALIMVLALLARLPGLWAPLNHDQAYTAVVFASSLRSALTDYHVPNNHVLHTVLVHFAISAFGIRPWAIRLPALLAGLLMIPTTYALAHALYDKYSGLMAALLVAAVPAQIQYTTDARGYPQVALLTLILLWLGDFVRKEENASAWFLIVLVSALGFWTIPVMLFPFGMLFVWMLMENWAARGGPYGSRRHFMKYWMAAGFGTAALAFILYFPLFVFTGFWKVLSNPYHFPLNQLAEMVQRHLSVYKEWIGGIPVWLSLLLGAGLVLSLVFHRRLSAHRVPIQLAAIAWFAILLLIVRPLPWTRIWFFLLAPVLIWCSAGTAGLLKDFHVKALRNVSPAIILIAGLALYPLIGAVKGVAALPAALTRIGREEAVVLFLRGQLRDGDLIVVPSPENAPIWYYAKVDGISDQYFDANRLYDRAFIVTLPVKEQRAETLAEQYHLTGVDWSSPRLLQELKGLYIYVVDKR